MSARNEDHGHALTLRQLLRQAFSGGKVIALRTSIKACAPQVPIPLLENLILSAKAIRASSEIAPFPYVKVAAGLVVQVLEIIQAARKNKEDFEELAKSLVDTITAVRDTLRAHHDNYSPPSEFVASCVDFSERLGKMLSDINEAVRQTRSWTRYLKTGEIQDTIAKYRRQIDAMRSNFTLTTVLQLALKMHAQQNIRQLGYTWEHSKPLRLVDAMNITIELPMDLCASPDDFGDMLNFLFRKRRGRRFVERRRYDLTVDEQCLVDQKSWGVIVRPGVTVLMDIRLLSDADSEKGDGRRCPACHHLCVGAYLGEEVTCPSCQTFFRVSQGIIEEVGMDMDIPEASGVPAPFVSRPSQLHPGPLGQRHDGDEDMDIRYFRRFHVVKQSRRKGVEALQAMTVDNRKHMQGEGRSHLGAKDRHVRHTSASSSPSPDGHPSRRIHTADFSRLPPSPSSLSIERFLRNPASTGISSTPPLHKETHNVAHSLLRGTQEGWSELDDEATAEALRKLDGLSKKDARTRATGSTHRTPLDISRGAKKELPSTFETPALHLKTHKVAHSLLRGTQEGWSGLDDEATAEALRKLDGRTRATESTHRTPLDIFREVKTELPSTFETPALHLNPAPSFEPLRRDRVSFYDFSIRRRVASSTDVSPEVAKKEARWVQREAERQRRELAEKINRELARAVMQKRNHAMQKAIDSDQGWGRDLIELSENPR